MIWRRLRNRREDTTEPGEPLALARERMVAEQIEARGLTDPELLRAFRSVPRHRFVDSTAPYADEALPLPAGQTISQPYVVALMTDAARPPRGWRGAKVLEIGTGSGYQAAILAELGAEVVSVERHTELSEEAGHRLADAGYESVVLVVGGGGKGGAPGGADGAGTAPAPGP